VKLEQCVEPMLRMDEFGAPMEVSADFTARLGPGALTGRFDLPPSAVPLDGQESSLQG